MSNTPSLNIDRYAVIGNPIAHSKSPLIHTMFAKQMQQTISYEAILAPIEGFNETIDRLRDAGFKGVNVTVPFKLEAYEKCDIKSSKAFMAGASNTLAFSEEGKILGHNTDGEGLIADIMTNLATSIKDKRVLLLGAGGAAEGVFQSILNESPALLTIANRTLSKAEKIVNKFDNRIQGCQACTFEDLSDLAFDIVINATSAGLNDQALPLPNGIYAKDSLAYDMVYGRETPFMKQASACQANVADGLGMLVEQAASAFKVWRGVKPLTAPVIQHIRSS